MTRAELLALAARVEAATGPKRALDVMIEDARGWPDALFTGDAQRYTRSHDAALSLASKWHVVAWGDMVADGLPGAVLLLSTDPVRYAFSVAHGTRESGVLARAMTAAALRAMAEGAADE
jgi:hypothetical protein